MPKNPAHRALITLTTALVIAGCVTPAAQDNALRHDAATLAGVAPANAVSANRNADESSADMTARVEELLAKPLTRDDAVTLALLNNPGLAARFAELRIDAAERVRASRPPNPSLTLGRFSRGNERETERGLSVDLIGLLAWPFTAGASNRQFDAARADALRDALSLAQETRAAWINAIAAGNALHYAQAVAEAAETGDIYAQRLLEAGSANRLESAQAKAFRIDAELARTRAHTQADAAREHLLRLLGIADPARLKLPTELPPLPESILPQPNAEQTGIDQRIDVQAAKKHAEATAKALHLNRVTRMVNVAEAGYHSNTSNVDAKQTGVEVTLELPLFDFGSAGSMETRARYDAALAEVAATAVNARSEIRSAWTQYQSAWQSARRYRDEALPLTSDITREMILRHNGMLIGPFELLTQAREQAAATARWHGLLREFWLAETNLSAALSGGSVRDLPSTDLPAAVNNAASGH